MICELNKFITVFCFVSNADKKTRMEEINAKRTRRTNNLHYIIYHLIRNNHNYYFTLAGLYGPQSILLKFQQILTDLPNDLTWVLAKQKRNCKKRKSSKFNAKDDKK